ncbi:hypothetical protein E7T09_04180 [Deinococcus sp. KSM4-11]|uniref:hypothetical protein n=1 Tax=Deinococcus sp. KSM4-11 TaxID=2568654 RepID=UPI0010A2CD0C|nr:hypothetical protein [Deinococcus sp. KSM4-11]THF88412.1 hypothetical protein E7T09_04180 [Deinococcus sp. KSM4-11]
MSRRDRQAAQQRINERQREQEYERDIEQAEDWSRRARLTAWYQRETLGRVRIREPFYLCELGLNDVTRGMTIPHATLLPDVIRVRRA